jgi:phenylacetate-CoA ligase
LGGATVYPFLAKQIQRAFHCPVLSAYGSRELGAVACQCLRGEGHHIASQAHLLETIDLAEKPVMDQEGELVATPLMNFAMPMIRYRIGDRGRLTKRLCACGRNVPLLEALTGRMVEVLVNSKGEQVDPIYFMMVLSEVFGSSAVRKSQVIQEKDRSVTMNLVLDKGVTLGPEDPMLQNARKKVSAVMGEDCALRFEFVEDIPLTPSGKFPYVLRR